MPRPPVHPVVAYSARARAKLVPAELSRVADVEAELSVVRVGAEAGGVESMLGPLQRLLEADSAGAYAPSRDGEGWSLTFGRFTGVAESGPTHLEAFMRRGAVWRPAYDMDRPDPKQWNRALRPLLLLDMEEWRASSMWHEVMLPAGVSDHDQLRVLVCDGPALLGWVGGFREEPFTRREQRRLAALSAALLRRLRVERRLHDAALMEAGLEAALGAIAAPAFIVRGNRIAFANDNGRAAFDTEPSLAGDLAEGTAAGFESTPIAVRGEPAARLVIRSAPHRDLGARVMAASRDWKLTPRQTDVLALVAAAESNKLIAAKLGCALRTAEVHVTALLRKAGSATRTELVARLMLLE